MFKINFDSDVFWNESKNGIGVVIQNQAGLVIASLSQQLLCAYQALEIEVLAAARALEFGLEIGVAMLF